MKKILIPIDFSEHSINALKVAAQIAKKNESEIILLHMLELPDQAGDALESHHEIPELMFFKNKAISKLEELMYADFLEDLTVSEIVQFEKTFEGIMSIAQKNNIDLIVMGSHGASGFKEMFIGSNTEKVVRFSEIPVLVIKRDEGEFNLEKFVFASDFTEEIKEPFKKVLDFTKKFESDLHLVMINTPSNFKPTHLALEIIHNFMKDFDIENYSTHIYNDVNIEKGILHFAKHINANIIGMCTHGRKGLSHFFNGSISEDLVNHAKRPVVTFKI